MPEHFDEDQPIYRESSPLLVVRTRLTPDIDDEGYPPPETATPENDPGLPVLFNRPLKSAFDDPLGSFDRAMSEPAESGQVNGESAVTAHNAKQSQPTNGDLKSLEATAAAAVQESDRDATLLGDPEDHASRTKRIDSAQDHEEEVSVPPTDQPSKSITEQPTSKVHPDPSPTKDASVPIQRDSIANSPTLSKHMHLPDQNAGHTLPAVKTVSPVKDSIAMSPQAPVLPSIKHLTDHLTGLAEAAMQHDTRATPSHSHSITSTMAPSPIQPMQPQYFPPNFHHPSSHTSPSGYHSGYSARSPTSTVGGDMSHYSSPHAPTTGATYFPDRRRSTSLNGKPPPFLSAMTPSMPSMPSTASSNENFSHPNSSTDGGYSTSHTTPIAADGSGEGLPRPLLPPPHGMNLPPIEGYRCEYPGCNAAPFQTQYLLTYDNLGPNSSDVSTDAPSQIASQCPQPSPLSLLPRQRLSTQRRRKGLQAQERDDQTRTRAQQSGVHMSVLSGSRTSISEAG
jgi:hypothetical protein